MKLQKIVAPVLPVVLLAGCASPVLTAPDVPAQLRPPASQTVFLAARATGVQIYECAPKADQSTVFEWAFRAPDATLMDQSGRVIGKHFAGPTWEASDGSSVVAETKARDPGPKATAIPWLLLEAKSVKGPGLLSKTQSIQRVDTTGGLAPTEPCTMEGAKRMARVPYTATYYFYGGVS